MWIQPPVVTQIQTDTQRSRWAELKGKAVELKLTIRDTVLLH